VHAFHHIQHGLAAGHKVRITNYICTGAAELHVELHDAADERRDTLRHEGEVNACLWEMEECGYEW